MLQDLRDLIKRADSASRASQGAEPLYIEAGRKLASLKAQYAMRKAKKRVRLRWAAFVKARVGVSKSRANELIQMADSDVTLAELGRQCSARTGGWPRNPPSP